MISLVIAESLDILNAALTLALSQDEVNVIFGSVRSLKSSRAVCSSDINPFAVLSFVVVIANYLHRDACGLLK